MGGWMAHDPELADELFIESLPEPWKRWCEEDFIEVYDVPRCYADKAWDDCNYRYADRMADAADNARKAEKERV